MNAVEPTSLTISARDGYPLGATVHGTPGTGDLALISGATGVPHRFYRRFAAHLADAGFSSVTYDYRGIGASAPASLRGFTASMTDWALLDMAGVLDWAAEKASGKVFMIGHSFGGQVAGLIDDPARVAGMVTFSSQSGYWRLQGREQKAVVAAHVHLTLPLLARLFGYVPWSRFSAGEDLPGGVARQWSRWCRHPRYLLGDPSLPLARFGEFRAPVLAYSFSDDKWGTAAAVDAMMQAYPDLERRHVTPAQVGLAHIGHMGSFKQAARPLWEETVDWLNRQRSHP